MRLSSFAKQTGTSLIETVLLIAVTGTLSAAAFSQMGIDSSDSSRARLLLSGMSNTLMEAARQSRFRAIADGVQHKARATVVLEQQPIQLVAGYPTASAAGIASALIALNGWQHQQGEEGQLIWTHESVVAENCHVVYQQPAKAGGLPGIHTVDSGC